jgi:hypothetical protein
MFTRHTSAIRRMGRKIRSEEKPRAIFTTRALAEGYSGRSAGLNSETGNAVSIRLDADGKGGRKVA